MTNSSLQSSTRVLELCGTSDSSLWLPAVDSDLPRVEKVGSIPTQVAEDSDKRQHYSMALLCVVIEGVAGDI